VEIKEILGYQTFELVLSGCYMIFHILPAIC